MLILAAAGGVGLLLIQMVKARGGRVIAVTSTEEKVELARGAGADETIGYEGFAERARELTGGVAVVYDSVGATTFEDGIDALRPRGMMVLFGQSSGPAPAYDPQRLQARSLYITRPGLPSYTATREELLARAGDVLELGRRRLAGRADRRALPARGRGGRAQGPRGAPDDRQAPADSLVSERLTGCSVGVHDDDVTPQSGLDCTGVSGTFARHV